MIKHESVIRSVAMAGRVSRYSTWPTIRQQSVGEHSHRVAMIYLQLFGQPRAGVLIYILQHDLGELFAGDTPFYAKREVPALKEAVNLAETEGLKTIGIQQPTLTSEEWKRFKICDLLEMYEFGKIEYRMGNEYGNIVSRNIVAALQTMCSGVELEGYVNKLWSGEVT
jgi:5'-deoxynucleotidase YfbR-like HD superfamily hydrolase